MGALQTILVALDALRANKLRSCLTALGIIIGVASVVTMVAVGNGAQTHVTDQIRALGANVLMVMPGAARQNGVKMQAGSRHTLTEGDAVALPSQILQVRAAAPSISGNAQIVRGNRNWSTTVNGTTAAHFVVRDWQFSAGRVFTAEEERSAGKVVVLGSTVARELFGEDSAVGQQIRIMNVPFDVVGVLHRKGEDQDDVVFVPIATAKLRFLGGASGINRDAVAYILVKATSDEEMKAAEGQIEALLRQRHRLRPDQDSDFEVNNPAAVLAAQQGATTTIAWLLAAIASVSLLVGGISIMNIMIVSVTERTREIGIRRAVGARGRDIRRQFLSEAVVLCLVGGLVGTGTGAGMSVAVAELAGWPVFLSPTSVLFAIGFAGMTGIFFGLYPAQKAAKLKPIEALKAD
jgi:putative ABC transport system permease protein